MKIAVITRHAIINYGSLLQAIATSQIIQKMGHSCEIIDYIREDEHYNRSEITLLKQKTEWYQNPLKRVLYLALRQPESIIAGRKFEKARQKYLKLTKRYVTAEQLQQDKPQADIYMTGSDQVWGPVGDGSHDDVYCLSFAGDDDKKISYAASFGHAQMTEELQSYYQKWLSRYEYITVREDKAVSLLEKVGIKAMQVLDPTLLLDGSFWNRYIHKEMNQKYVLVYQIHNDKNLNRYAKKVAKEKGLPLIRISASFHQAMRGGKFVWCPEIGDFLSYIKNAECLITDSFHGTAFAINFNTPFVEVLPNNNTESRNESILRLTNLDDRILKSENDLALADKPIDFSFANQILEKKRKESLEILMKMIDDVSMQCKE